MINDWEQKFGKILDPEVSLRPSLRGGSIVPFLGRQKGMPTGNVEPAKGLFMRTGIRH